MNRRDFPDHNKCGGIGSAYRDCVAPVGPDCAAGQRADGSLGDLRDTTLVDAGGTCDIVCVFDNLGKWLLHCHMLGHQAAGMKTWLEVT